MTVFAELSPPYATIVADPPWRYESAATKADAGQQYSTMSLGEIMDLPVTELAAPAAHLWLWCTNALMEAGYGVVRAWGFRPVTVVTWCKPGPGGRSLPAEQHGALHSRYSGSGPGAHRQAALNVVRVASRRSLRQAGCLRRPGGAGVSGSVRRAVLPPSPPWVGFVGQGLRDRRCGVSKPAPGWEVVYGLIATRVSHRMPVTHSAFCECGWQVGPWRGRLGSWLVGRLFHHHLMKGCG